MNWYYVSDQQQRGPVSDTELDELIRRGTIEPNTLVWRTGLTEWQPLDAVRPTAVLSMGARSPSDAMAGTATCAECRQMFAQTAMIRLNHAWVCAGCKPLFLQRLSEGAAPAAAGVVWRSARQIVMRPETPLPDACVLCNAPAQGYRLKRKLYWHSPYIYLLILISLLVYAIVAVCVRKKAVINIGLCGKHQKQRKWFIAGAWLAVLAGVSMLVAGVSGNGSGALIVGGLTLSIVAAVVGISKGAVVSAAKIDKDLVWVKGARPVYLTNLPEWTGPRS